jgi:hypothetical protein
MRTDSRQKPGPYYERTDRAVAARRTRYLRLSGAVEVAQKRVDFAADRLQQAKDAVKSTQDYMEDRNAKALRVYKALGEIREIAMEGPRTALSSRELLGGVWDVYEHLTDEYLKAEAELPEREANVGVRAAELGKLEARLSHLESDRERTAVLHDRYRTNLVNRGERLIHPELSGSLSQQGIPGEGPSRLSAWRD